MRMQFPGCRGAPSPAMSRSDILEAAEILIIRFQIKIADTERDDLGARLGDRTRPANDAVAEGGHRPP